MLFYLSVVSAKQISVAGPDNELRVTITVKDGVPFYNVTYKDKIMLEDSPLGFIANIGNFSKGMSYVKHHGQTVDKTYRQDRIKQSSVHYQANKMTVTLANSDNKEVDVVFSVSNNDIAFRYELPKYGETGSIVIEKETTGFRFPRQTTTFLTPQSDAMIGWKQTKPSYEEEYTVDAPMNVRSQYGHGFTFPCLYKIDGNGWVLISETGVDSRYCDSRLSDADNGLYSIEFPMAEENNGNETSSPAFSLPGATAWRTITVGETLKPIVETTVPWDVLEPLYPTKYDYKFGRGTWSWIMWQDNSINYDDQIRYIDFAADMGYEYVLIDNWWDTRIGRENIEKLAVYAQRKNVNIFLWYSSSGYWNDIVQGPTNLMDNPIARKDEIRWMQDLGIKGIKVDFFGGDKQETMRLYEAILSDADDHGLMVIFHGCTLPRDWERMYPNYVGSEAVLASENLYFQQHFCDNEAFNATLYPFIRNTVGCMEFGGMVLNKRLNRNNISGSIRRTGDIFQLATSILFQNLVQFFALTPNNMEDAPSICIDFMKNVPTTWEETRFIDGYPGKYIVLARRHDNQWYVATINAMEEPLNLKVSLPMIAGQTVDYYADIKALEPRLNTLKIKNDGTAQFTVQPQGGVVLVK